MTLLQCRRFQFFDLEKVDLDITIKENLKEAQVCCGTSGRGRIIIGDSRGSIHSISRQLHSKIIAEAHEKGVLKLHLLKQSPFLFSMGEDDLALFSVKVWDSGPLEYDSAKNQLVLKRVFNLMKTKRPTCFAVHENLLLLAVGYSDGYLHIFRGEITRDRNVKPRTLLVEGDYGEVTGLFFKAIGTSIILFVSTKHSIFVFDVTTKDKDARIFSDKPGCDPNCSCFAEGSLEDFLVGRNDAVYCYQHDELGSCHGFDGEKHLLYHFRGYLLIVSRVKSQVFSLTIFDCANKFVAFSSPLMTPESITVAASEWGSLFILTSDGNLWQLREKDLQTKMSVFYKKNHYDLAVKVAKSNGLDRDGMADIFRQYGDHLYSKGDFEGAIKHYCKTVGKLEASYVVRKYLDASRVLNLLEYLEVVHKTGNATPDLTTLLLNCLTKLKLHDKVERYVKDPSCDFLEPETAIKVFRKGGMSKQAYQLAHKHNLYGNALQILLEDVRDPSKEDLYLILEKVVHEEDAEVVLRRYGSDLVQFLCHSDTKASDDWKKIVVLLCESPVKRELVDLFIARKDILVPLLENICQDFENEDGPLMNLLLEAYLDQWSRNKDTDLATRGKILALMSKAPDCATWDWPRALFSCKMLGFSPGEIIAFEKLGLHSDLLSIRYTAAINAPVLWPQFITTVREYATKGNKISLWKDAFLLVTSGIEGKSTCPTEIISEILNKLLEEGLMEPLQILDRLSQTNLKLGSIRSFLMHVLDRTEMDEDETLISHLHEETETIRSQIQAIQNKPSVFQGTRCNICSQKLEMPSVHFLCLHSFHQHCFDSYAANDKDCPVCWEQNKKILGPESSENKLSKAAIEADFTIKLGSAKSNSFSVLADFFSKGIFTEEPSPDSHSALTQKKSIEKLRLPSSVPAFELSHGHDYTLTEARLRLHEGSTGTFSSVPPNKVADAASIESYLEAQAQLKSQAMIPESSTSLPFPRVSASKPKPSASMSPQRSPREPRKKPGISSSRPKTIASAVELSKPEPKNPFEEDDDSKNPFLEDIEPKKTINPFEEDEDNKPPKNPFEDD